MEQFEERPRKVHLYQDNHGAKFKRRGSGKVDNTLCKSNHGNNGLLTTSNKDEVTCLRCLRLIEQQTPDAVRAELSAMLDERNDELQKAEDLVEIYRQRERKLELTLEFALKELGGEQFALVHVPTQTTVGDIIRAVLAQKVKHA